MPSTSCLCLPIAATLCRVDSYHHFISCQRYPNLINLYVCNKWMKSGDEETSFSTHSWFPFLLIEPTQIKIEINKKNRKKKTGKIIYAVNFIPIFDPDVGNEWEGKREADTQLDSIGRAALAVMYTEELIIIWIKKKIFVITHYRHKLGVSCSK